MSAHLGFLGLQNVAVPDDGAPAVTTRVAALHGDVDVQRGGNRLRITFDNDNDDARAHAPLVGTIRLTVTARIPDEGSVVVESVARNSSITIVLRIPARGQDRWLSVSERKVQALIDATSATEPMFLGLVPGLNLTEELRLLLPEWRLLRAGRFQWKDAEPDGEILRLSFRRAGKEWSLTRYRLDGTREKGVDDVSGGFGSMQSEAAINSFSHELGGSDEVDRQPLQLRTIEAVLDAADDEATALTVAFKPAARDRVLDIDPAVLTRGQPASRENPIGFGTSLANGELRLPLNRRLLDATSQDHYPLEWCPSTGHEAEGVMVLVHGTCCENGLPLAVLHNGSIHLRERADYYSNRGSAYADAMSLGGLNIANDVSGRLSQLEVETNVTRLRGDDLEYRVDLENERVVPANRLPHHLHGFAVNTFATLPRSESVPFPDSEYEPVVNATLRVETVPYPDRMGPAPDLPAFMLTSLELDGLPDATLETVFEEEDYVPESREEAAAESELDGVLAPVKVGRRRSSSSSRTLNLPATDIRSGVANMGRSPTALRAQTWYRDLDEHARKAFEGVGKTGEQLHLSKFLMKPPGTIGYETVLGRLYKDAPSLTRTRPNPVLTRIREPEEHGDEDDVLTTFEFGRPPGAGSRPESAGESAARPSREAITEDQVEDVLHAIKLRVWALQYAVAGVRRERDELGDGADAWLVVKAAIDRLRQAPATKLAKLDAIRLEVLQNLEGLTEPTRDLRQSLLLLARVSHGTLVALRAQAAGASAVLKKIADPAEFERLWIKVKTTADDQLDEAERAFKMVAGHVQATVRTWQGIADPDNYEIRELADVKPVYHRITQSLARVANMPAVEMRKLESLLGDALLGKLKRSGENLFEEFEDAWVRGKGRLHGEFNAQREQFDALKNALLWSFEQTQNELLRVAERMAGIATGLKASGPTGDWTADDIRYIQAIERYFTALEDELSKLRVPDFKMLVRQGREYIGQRLREEWEKAEDDLAQVIRQLRDEIGIAAFSDEVLEEILARVEESEELARKLAETLELGEDAADLLRHFKNEPPEYVVVGKHFHVQYADRPTGGGPRRNPLDELSSILERLMAMWGRSFELCNLGAGNAWDFELDTGAVAILKLSREKSLADILIEIQLKYTEDTGEPDPLNLWDPLFNRVGGPGIEPPHAVRRRSRREITDWTKRLTTYWVGQFVDHEVRNNYWQGAFVVQPLADLDRNPMTRSLCGLKYIRARYVALGGDKLEFRNGDELVETLDVYATVYQEAEKQRRQREAGERTETDAGVALVKFDARIKNTRLQANSSIELKLDLDRLFGRHPGDYAADDEAERGPFRNITIRGAAKEPKDPSAGVHIEFAAVFDGVYTIPIEVACFKAIEMRSIRAALRNGRASLEIDADLVLQNWQPEAFEFEFEFEIEDGARLLLSNFRLNFPPVKDVVDKAMGALRDMLFDLDAVEFWFPTPRAVTLGVMELKLQAVGYIRPFANNQPSQPLLALRQRYDEIIGHNIPDGTDARFEGFPYFIFDVDFGKFPKFGESNLERLELRLLTGFNRIGTHIDDYKLVVALGGLTGKNIRFDFFRLLSLSIAKLYLSKNVRVPKDVSANLQRYRGDRFTVIGAEDIRLQLVGIDLIGKQSGSPGGDGKRGLDFLMLQNERGERGMLGMLHFDSGDDGADRGLVEVQWLLLGRNIEVDTHILDHLILDRPGGRELLQSVVRRKRNDGPSGEGWIVEEVAAGLTGRNDWLFGISFSILEILDNCRLLMQEDVYYGIGIVADWLEPLIGGTRMTLAYIPGPTSKQDRFLLEIPLAFLDFVAEMQAGWGTFSWALNTDTLVGLGFPFRHGARYRWDRSFALFVSPAMGQAGFYVEKRTHALRGRDAKGREIMEIGGGFGFTVGLGFAAGNRFIYVRAGIGIFAIIEGAIMLDLKSGRSNWAKTVVGFRIHGVIGVIAFVEGGINIYIISAKFRAEIQAALAAGIEYVRDLKPFQVTYRATLYAGYFAKASINLGFKKITFEVRGEFPISIEGQHLLE